MIYLKEMRLVNCQSWSNNTIQFTPGLNVIQADNNTGKSVIMKMLKMTNTPEIYNKRDWKFLIRHGAECAEVYYLFSNMAMVVTRVFTNKVIYLYTPKYKEVDFIQYQDSPPEEIHSLFGMLVERESNFIANLLDLDQALFFVTSNSKANSLIKVLTQHEQLNRLGVLFKNKIPQYRELKLKVAEKKIAIDSKLQTVDYTNLTSLERKVECLETYTPSYKKLIETYNIIYNMSKLVREYISCDELIEICDIVIVLEEIQKISEDVDTSTEWKNVSLLEQQIMLCDSILKLEEIYNLGEDINTDIEYYDIETLENNIQLCDSLLKLEEIYKVLDVDTSMKILDMDLLTRDINTCNTIIKLEELEKSFTISDINFVDTNTLNRTLTFIEIFLECEDIKSNIPKESELNIFNNMLDIYELSENVDITISDIQIKEQESHLRLLEMTSELEALAEIATEVNTHITEAYVNECELNIESLAKLKEIYNAVASIYTANIKVNSQINIINDLEEKLNKLGKEINCPIYGKIKYYNGECLRLEK